MTLLSSTKKWTRGKIAKAGIYSNMPLDRYHRGDVCDGPSISSSGLRRIYNASPLHYWADSPLNPNRVERDAPTPRHFVLGRAAHHLMLGEEGFARLFRRAPDRVPGTDGVLREWSMRTNYAQSWVESRRREGLEVIFPDEVPILDGMARAMNKYWLAAKGGFNGYVERSAFWRHPSGVWLKVRPDVIPSDSGDFVDLKTCASALDQDVDRAIRQHGYRQQFALMRYVFRKLGLPVASSTLVFIEKEPPHAFNAVALDEADLDVAERQMMQALATFVRCLKSGEWPGPGGEGHIRTFRMSDREREAAESRLDREESTEDEEKAA